MTLAKFARLCEYIEHRTPTVKASEINKAMSGFSDRTMFIKILSMDYPVNNIGSQRAVKWIASALGSFEDEIELTTTIWGDIGEGIQQFDEGNETDSEITLKQFNSLLEMNCSTMKSNSYSLFKEHLVKMSAREKKWFIRYWLKVPRNGVIKTQIIKAIAKYYSVDKKLIAKYYQYNSLSDIVSSFESDAIPECVLEHGSFVMPMLAKPRKGKEIHKENIIDVKYDGNRYQIHKKDESVIIFNRKGKIATPQYTDIVSLVKQFDCNHLIMDTEIYPIDTDGSPAPHQKLATRVHSKNKAVAIERVPVKLAVFDMLSYEGNTLLEMPLKERIKYIKNIPEEYRAVVFDGTITSAYNIAINDGFEGVMIKDANAPYHPGKRSKAWLKYKPPRFNLDVVITSAKYGEGKRAHVFGTFGISVRNDTGFVSIGSIGTGFKEYELTMLTRELRKAIERYDNNTHYFLPRIVLEITCDMVTTDSDGNIGLRFPRCLKIREDKYVSDIDTVQSVTEMMI